MRTRRKPTATRIRKKTSVRAIRSDRQRLRYGKRPRTTTNSKRQPLPSSAAFPASRWYLEGVRDGERWRQSRQTDSIPTEEARSAAFQAWSGKYDEGLVPKGIEWKKLLGYGQKYAAGFLSGFADVKPILPVPLRTTAAAVVCATAPLLGLDRVIRELDALPIRQIIVVIYGVPIQELPMKTDNPRVLCLIWPEVTDPDVGRALGAKLADADTLLFADAEKPVAAGALARFLWECDGRADIALNDLSMRTIGFHRRGGIQRLQEFLNAGLNRPDLKSNSLSALPYALSRKALNTIGAATLCVPAKAHAVAIMSKLRIVTGGAAGSSAQPSDDRIVAGDHAEAWHTAIEMRGSRLGRPDHRRNRTILEHSDR